MMNNHSITTVFSVEFYEQWLTESKQILYWLVANNPEPRHRYAQYEIEATEEKISMIERKIEEMKE